MRSIRAILVLSLIALPTTAGVAGTRIWAVHWQRLKLSPTARQDLVLEDLRSILTGPSSSTSIATTPYPSSEPNLCRRDVIELSYAESGSGKTAHYKPEGIHSVSVEYRYLDLPKSIADRRKVCAALDRAHDTWVSSYDGDHYVAFALARLAETLADVRAGVHVTLNCEDKQLDCGAEFLSAAREVSMANRCANSSSECYEYFTGHWRVTIVTEYRDNTPHTTIDLFQRDIAVS